MKIRRSTVRLALHDVGCRDEINHFELGDGESVVLVNLPNETAALRFTAALAIRITEGKPRRLPSVVLDALKKAELGHRHDHVFLRLRGWELTES